jgi:hypothetical protein
LLHNYIILISWRKFIFSYGRGAAPSHQKEHERTGIHVGVTDPSRRRAAGFKGVLMVRRVRNGGVSSLR